MQQTALPRPTKQYLDNCRWILEHYSELVEKFGIGWIGVHAGHVLAAGSSLGDVTREAEQLGPADDIAFQFIDDATMIYLS